MSDAPASASDDFERAHRALLEITAADTIGERVGSIDEGDGVVTVHFDVTSPGYRGWRWTASIAHVDGLEPSVLETEMTPGDDSVLAPEWVPWVDRLADYRAAQDSGTDVASPDSDDDDAGDGDDDDASDADDQSDDDDDDEDDDEDDEDEDDEEEDAGVGSLLHAGDLDGVDIDEVEVEDEVPDEDGEDDRDGSASVTADGVDQREDPEQQPDSAGDEPLRVPSADQAAGDQ